uniref:Serine protease n=1 Tax=Petromyzon marinus TaxID=7757 RepID=S4RE80_PETMA
TCIHLNDGYIMTCYHVIDLALSLIEISFSHDIHTRCVKDIADNIFVCFDYVSYDKEPTWMELDEKLKRFGDNLDFVILKLAVNPESVPFGGLCEDGEPKGKVALIGHPGGDLREIDFTDIVLPAKRDEMARNKCTRKYGTHLYGYKDFMSVDRVTYDTSFFHGASGSPVINTSGKLVAMHTSGLLLEQKKTVRYILEIGVEIRAIINYVRKHNPEL